MTIEQLETVGKKFHDATKHSPLSVMLDPNYVDASTQPTAFKSYPNFYRRFPLDENNSVHNFIRLTSAITFEKKYKYDSYQLRVNPSAGALYPTEIYVQIRGIKGIVDGIYHLEVATDSLTLIYELIDDGLESYILPNCLVKGLIFLVSCAYFRSSWKYKNRSLRYCFLDSGHHLGAIEASAYLYQKDIQVIFNFDKIALNNDLGFENKEFVTASVVSGEIKSKTIRKLRSPLPFVSSTDYFEVNPLIEAGYKATVFQDFKNNLFPNKNIVLQSPPFSYQLEQFRETIITRRSARAFKRGEISQLEWLQIWQCLTQPLLTISKETIEIYLVINYIEGMESGLYRGLQLLQSKDFSEKAKYLCVNQALARDSAVTLFLTSTYSNYQTAMQAAGWLGQRLYLISNYLGIGCSGIGAYHDDEIQEFLGTNKDILYVIAIGR
ncbi:Nitroreductase family protein [Hyella patelloides LEGE 07179]|uniref:Nitroreductase family protein n=1 Tax=Hyella patelloides LEGE 07179 TaxID=945734 RepID=A0A563VR30_9CYAN|nr:nitroreductase family protein [Hyella patelloides]VEP13864.1 Nitroreductase family protein [Hyella patelloides LEGE 07179]